MELVEDESIATASTAAPKFFSKPRMDHHIRTVDTTMSSSSMLSIETHPPSARSSNPFSHQPSSSDTFDSRHDSPKNEQQHVDSDAMMTSADASSGLVLPSSVIRTRVVTGESIAGNASTTNITTVNTFAREEKVSLAPRFGKLETGSRDDLDQQRAEGEHDLGNASMFSLSGSMSSEFLENQQQSDDHQQEYLRHPNRLTMGMNSPTSTTARDFLREVQGPPPLPRDESLSRSFGSQSLPLHHRFGGVPTSQRPPFHPPSSGATSVLPPSPSLPQIPSLTHTSNSKTHPTLPREHILNNASSPSPTNTIPGIGGFNCDREKPVISRCFAWSQDSQDDRRITKRARTVPNGVASSASSPLSTETAGVMSPSSALETIRGSSTSSIASSQIKSVPEGRTPPGSSSSPTKVHWEEKVEHSNELMSHAAVDPQVLFGVTSAIQIAVNSNEDIAMGNTEEEGNSNQQTDDDRMPPPISTAHSASHYSFDSL